MATPDSDEDIITDPDFTSAVESIADWTQRPDFPRCALGAHVNIRGFEGVVVQIIGRSLKIVSKDGVKQRFNGDRLKTLFAPRDPNPPKPKPRLMPKKKPVAPDPDVEPDREYIDDPDFTAPVRAIRVYATQPDFPQCAYGKHVEIPGYVGVVIEIVKETLKIQAESGGIRRFNGRVLKKLYGTP